MAKQYTIPMNINQSGRMLNGLLETRRVIEAAAGAVIGFIFCSIIPLPMGAFKISLYVFVCLLLAFIGFIGIQGEPVSRFLLFWWKWRKVRKKPYFYNYACRTFTVSAAELHIEEAENNALADMLDHLKAKLSSAPAEHTEGETFVFAEDPVEQWLLAAQEQRSAQTGETDQPAAPEAPAVAEPPEENDFFSQEVSEINFDNILDTLNGGDTNG